MAELATIARPYAEALFKASAGDADATLAWLEPLAQVAGSAQLQEAAANPRLGAEQVYGLIAGLVPQGLPQAGQNFLRMVLENGRLAALPEVAAQFHALVNQQAGVSDAVIHSAFPIEPAQLGDVVAALEKRFDRKVNLATAVDPELIGGAVVRAGDLTIDGSLKSRLERLALDLTA